MREIKIGLIGKTPLLMHNIAGMRDEGVGSVRVIPPPEEEAWNGLYWTDASQTELAVPAKAVHESFRKAAMKTKIKSVTGVAKAAGTVMIYAVAVTPEMIPLGTAEYEVDVRSVVVKRNRIRRGRGLVFPWALTFTMQFDEHWLTVAAMRRFMPEVIKVAGQTIGILDYRPEKKGTFGRYRLAHFELLPEREWEKDPEPEVIGFPTDWDEGMEMKPAARRARKKAA